MIGEIFYLVAIIICPCIYMYLSQYFRKNLTNIQHHKSINKFHNYLFVVVQLFLSLLVIDYLVVGKFLIEFLFATGIILILSFIYKKKIYRLYKFINDTDLYKQIFSIMVAPVLVMNIVRNYFDTYTIGSMIFNLSNIAIILWEISILSLISLSHLLYSVYHHHNYLVIAIFIFYISKLF